MGATAATVSIKLDAQTAELKRGFAETKGAINSLASGMSGSVAAGMLKANAAIATVTAAFDGLRGVVNGVFDSMNQMADMGDFADRIGIGVEALQALRLVAETTGGSAEAMDTALQKLSMNVADAAVNGGAMADKFAAMGLNAKALAELPVEQQLLAVSDAIKGMSTAGEQNAAIVDLMGRSAVELGSTLRGGSAALLELTNGAKEHGIASSEMVAASQAGADAIKRLSHSWQMFKNILASYVVPAILKVVEGLTWILDKIGKLFGMTSGRAPMKALSEDAKRATTTVERAADSTVAASKKIEAVTSKAVDLKKELDAVSVAATPGIGAVTRSSAEGFSAVQAANRASADAERRHAEQLRALRDILRAVARGDVVLAPVRI